MDSPQRTRYCEFEGCNNTTREGKPFCPIHVHEHDYVRGIEEKLEAFEEGQRFLKKGRVLDTDGVFVEEVLQLLRTGGEGTLERFQRKLQSIGVSLTVGEAKVLVKQLAKAGLVRLGRTTRGNIVIQAI